jgi:hypothetical protein
MSNLINFQNIRVSAMAQSVQKFLGLRQLANLDLIARLINFSHFNKSLGRGVGWLILFAALVQIVAQYLPIISWFTWPFLVYICSQSIQDKGGQNTGKLQYLIQILKLIRSKIEVVIALFLYGALSLIIFRGLMEGLNWLHIDWEVLPPSVITLLPFTLPESIAVLFIATCAHNLNIDDQDPFKTLSLSLRDLLVAPISTLLILISQSVLWTYVAMSLTLYFKSPLLSTFLGHMPYILFILIWSCGQPIQKKENYWVESVK